MLNSLLTNSQAHQIQDSSDRYHSFDGQRTWISKYKRGVAVGCLSAAAMLMIQTQRAPSKPSELVLQEQTYALVPLF